MNTLELIVLVVLVVLALLFLGGYLASGRRRGGERAALVARTEQADQQLAAAHAEDNGWAPDALETAARAAAAGPVRSLTLVQVVDRPGTEADEAVFDADGQRIVLARHGDEWVAR